ncbi:hypothetical protein JCGZ_09913 [Jatropha curcas]|uniref:Uncharacterized protein n=1 Tax=Jatropha curcas TaxID=180498 RepID=A0A067KI84_JATCU|nr:hypothetical protein JCGZ_09913 [Jatropha curcas]
MQTFTVLWSILLLFTCLEKGVVCLVHAELMYCKESDRRGLLDFKKGLEDSDNRLSSWTGSNCCHWWGVTCDNTTGTVVAVDLRNPSGFDFSGRYGIWTLSGEISPSLTKLKFLKYLDLSFNSFNGKIPDFLSSFEYLQYLNLSNAGFSGAITSNLGNLSNLQVLDISSDFQDLTVENFDWMTGLLSLKHLAMGQVDLSKIGEGWVEALNKLPFLTELHLPFCGLSSFIYSLPVVNFTSLEVIDLSHNDFNSKLPNWIVNISTLVSVDISSSSLYGRIPLGFGELPNLQSLELHQNENLSGSCSQLFKETWRKIQVIDFTINKLHGRLPSSLGNMTSLIYLRLSSNGIQGEIPSSIGMLCNLKHIALSLNNLTGNLPEFLQEAKNCPSKSPLPNLQHLELFGNQLVGKLPDWIGKLKNLVILELGYNSFEGPIPHSFGNLQHLYVLNLKANKLNGSLPDSIGKIPELFILDVSLNEMTGIISEVNFLRLSKLKTLTISANSFILNVSSNWVPPFQLNLLGMGSCLLGPSFPSWLKSQKEIFYVDFSNASISGFIPNWFWEMSSNLYFLNVSFNSMEGNLPNPFSIFPFAIVDMSSNHFCGPIPLPNVEVELLDLSSNNFSGPLPENIVPASIGEMLSLEIIDLSRNNLTGRIPSSIGNCSSLIVLDFQNNILSGEIPTSLGQLNLLQTLHLSNNRFSGEIPSAFQNLTNLETLDLRNSRLTGNIPSWIGKSYPYLRILSLRSNAFYGELPSALSNLSSLQVLDLAENELNGSIPDSFGSLKAMTKQKNLNHYFFNGHYLFTGPYTGHFFQENLVVNVKGQSLEYTKTLSLLTSIDLSGNNLYGVIPEEITKLVGLEFLNLSRNYISGKIPKNISELHQLLSLDLSSNMLSGPIPSCMSSMTFLAYLNLSDNSLSGKIPYEGQMTTFSAPSFSGNSDLCGEPLLKCLPDVSNNGSNNAGSDDEKTTKPGKWFDLSIGLGFAVDEEEFSKVVD